jgi:hypothetical protein
MGTNTRAELPVIFDCNLGEDGLAEFEPEVQRPALGLRQDRPAGADVQPWRPYVAPPPRRWWPFVLLVVAAGVSAGGVASWLALSAGSGSLPSTPPPSQPNVLSRVSSDVPIVAPVHATVSKPAARSLAEEPSRVDPALEQTLALVSAAYRARDAQSLASVWPGADTAALTAAFSDLKYQALSFDHCAVHPSGASGGVASCDVTIATAPKDGDPALQRRRESWTLLLDRSGDRWTITGASVR